MLSVIIIPKNFCIDPTQIAQSHTQILQVKTSNRGQPKPSALAFAPPSWEWTKLSLETKQGPPGILQQAHDRAVLSRAPQDWRASCSWRSTLPCESIWTSSGNKVWPKYSTKPMALLLSLVWTLSLLLSSGMLTIQFYTTIKGLKLKPVSNPILNITCQGAMKLHGCSMPAPPLCYAGPPSASRPFPLFSPHRLQQAQLVKVPAQPLQRLCLTSEQHPVTIKEIDRHKGICQRSHASGAICNQNSHYLE